MWKRLTAIGVGVLLLTGGLTAAGSWNDRRIAACERRSDRLSALGLLQRQPDGFRPASPPASSGCDPEHVVASASQQFIVDSGPAVDTLSGLVAGRVDEQAVEQFYRQAFKDDAWQLAARPATPGPDAANLCARNDSPLGRTYITLSFPVAGMYELTAADSIDPALSCRW